MKINLPGWVDKRTRITVMAGIEPVIKREDGVWYKKIQRCDKCGKCCMERECQHLKYEANEYLCNLGVNRPYMCCIGDGWDVDCNIEWETI